MVRTHVGRAYSWQPDRQEVVLVAIVAVPEAFAQITIAREGARGAAWIDELPSIVNGLLEQWQLRRDGEIRHGQVGLIVPVLRRSDPAVLKVSFPHEGNRSEGWALRAFSGHACVRVYAEESDRYALLLERARDVGPATVLDVDEWMQVAARIAGELAVAAPADAPALADSAAGWELQLDRQLAHAPELLPERAIARARDTIRAIGHDVGRTLIHGDLHERNVLAGYRRPWLAVDPKGYRGPIAWDAFTVCLTRITELAAAADPAAELRARLQRFAALTGSDAEFAIEVAHARTVSSWLHESTGGGAVFGRRLLERITSAL